MHRAGLLGREAAQQKGEGVGADRVLLGDPRQRGHVPVGGCWAGAPAGRPAATHPTTRRSQGRKGGENGCPPGGPPLTAWGADQERPRQQLIGGYDLSGGPHTTGKRADGRPWVRVALPTIDGRHHVDYAVAWPYRCAPGSPCPRYLKLRVLLLQVYGYDRDWTAVDSAARQMVQTAQPITNAVQAPATGRSACDLADPLNWLEDAKRTADGGVRIRMELLGGAVSCHAQGKLAVVVKVGAKLAPVRGAGAAVTLDGDLPEQAGRLSATWTWTNWCDSKHVTLWRVDPDQPGREQQLFLLRPLEILPRCIDRHRPSTLEAVSTTR